MSSLFIDYEANGFGSMSYPVQLGWASDANGLPGGEVLIRPTEAWLRLPWDHDAEKVHRISLDHLMVHGRPVQEVADLLVTIFAQGSVFSDQPHLETLWSRRLLEAAAVEHSFRIQDAYEDLMLEQLRRNMSEEEARKAFNAVIGVVDEIYPRRHRAGADSRNMAAASRAVWNPRFRNELRKKRSAQNPIVI